MSPPRILALHGPARDDLHRSVLRELAEALRDDGAEVRVADALDPCPTPARWRPDATLSMSARDARPEFATAALTCALDPPFADPTSPEIPRLLTLYGAPSGVLSWHRGPYVLSPLWGAPTSLAEISPRGPRPVDVLLVGSWRSPEEHLRALRHAVPGDTFARALDLCAHTLAQPEPIDGAFARRFALADLDPDSARALIRQVLPRLRAWDRAVRLDAAFNTLCDSDFSVLWVGATSGARTARADHIARRDLRFQHKAKAMPVSSDPYSSAAQEDRCSPRTRLTIPATLRASGGRAFQSVVHDLSISGFSAASINRMHEGQLCWLTLPGLESLQAEVVWWDNCIVGCAFSELLSPIVHDNILQRYSNVGVYRQMI